MTLPAGAALACLLCAAQGPGHTGHRQQDGQQGQQGQGHPVWALHRGQGGHLQCHPGKKTTESLVTSYVNQALEDLIMVSYTGPGDRLFQGVLLDATKRFNTWNKSCNVGSFHFEWHFFAAKLKEVICTFKTQDRLLLFCANYQL